MIRQMIRAGPLSLFGVLLLWLPAARAAENVAAGANEPVAIALRVPANAEVWFDNSKTTQTGVARQFVSPPLSHGRDYSYQLRVRWTEGERTVERTRRLTFRAGDQLVVDYAGTSNLTEIRSFYQAPGAGVPDSQRPASTPALVPVWFMPLAPSFTPVPNVSPMSEQEPWHRFGPPGSNYRPSFGPGNG